MTSENVAEHIVGALIGIEFGIEPDKIEPPAADSDRARRLARRGIPVNTMLRAHRLAQAIVINRMIEALPRLTDDAELVSASARELIELATGYVDRTSEQGVVAFQEERDRRLRWRLSMVNEAGMRIGTTLDIARTAEELAGLATEHFADLATVDLLDSLLVGQDAAAGAPLTMRRYAQRSVTDDSPGTGITPKQLHSYPVSSRLHRALTTGQPGRYHADGPDDRSAIHSTLAVPLRARRTTLGVAQFSRGRNPDRYDDEDLLLAQEIVARAAVAVDNARRYTHARATALTLQRSLLQTRAPEQSAVEVACRYLPAGTELGVGGGDAVGVGGGGCRQDTGEGGGGA
ncbi:GAF domain-containing protein [Streptomyces hyaluromycini]|uniref:GAF domain-containing protein n=1 Tax=Streptomyces hyaluromycini TaxID=1377993 RepID=UPI000D1B8653|nr:GAF domain-containing protein [Streptomyces hyaluromycini]